MATKKEENKVRAQPPALNPESCAITQPWKDFIGRGFISCMKIEFTPMGNSVKCSVQASLGKPEDPSDGFIPIGEAKNRIIEAKLWAPKERSKKSEPNDKDNLPKKSLVKADFEGKSKEEFLKRAKAVAEATGDTTARGRIGSLKMYIEGVDTFEEWWSSATPKEKTRLLTDKKNHDSLTDQMHIDASIALKQCPFRGSVPKDPKEDDEEEIPQENALVSAKASSSQSPKGKGKA